MVEVMWSPENDLELSEFIETEKTFDFTNPIAARLKRTIYRPSETPALLMVLESDILERAIELFPHEYSSWLSSYTPEMREEVRLYIYYMIL